MWSKSRFCSSDGGPITIVRPLAEAGTAIAEHPRVAVVVGAERAADPERVEQLAQALHRMPLARILVVVRDLGDGGVCARMLELEARHEHAAAAAGRQRE